MNGLTHDNSDNWYVFETQTAGDRFLLRDDISGEIVPATCNIAGRSAPDSYCRDSTVIVNDILLGFFDHQPSGSYIELAEPVPAGTVIQISPITERFQGGLGGNRASGDPHGFVDGPPGVPGSGYFQVSGGPRIEWAGIVQAIPELCEVVNTPSLVRFVERYLDSGLQMANDPCAPPSTADVNSGTCDVFRSRGCVDYGLVNNGTVRWGPDPRDNTQCVNNNTLLTLSDGEWRETFEDRGDNGRYSRLDGVKNNGLPKTYPNQYLAFKGDRNCGAQTPSNLRPSVSITAPSSGEVFSEGDSITFSANASDADGTVANVTFSINNTVIGDPDQSSPYSTSFSAGAPGTYILEATATDNDGAVSSNTRTIVVNQPTNNTLRDPDVPIGSLSAGVRYDYYKFTDLTDLNSVDDLSGAAAANGILNAPDLSVAETDPNNYNNYGFVYSGYIVVPEDGVYTFYTTSNDGSNFSIGNTLVVDNDGEHIATEESGEIGLKAGLHKFSMRYFQSGGSSDFNFAWQGPNISKTVIPTSVWRRDDADTSANAVPTIELVKPTQGNEFSTEEIIELSAIASDADGFIEQVDFYINNQRVATDTSAPYTFSWSTNQPANYTVSAQAIDNEGGTSNSLVVSFLVNQGISTPIPPAEDKDNQLCLPIRTLNGNVAFICL